MYCYHHPDRTAVGTCVECSEAVCPECKVEFNGRIYCNSCIEKKVAGKSGLPAYDPISGQVINTSGMGSKAAIPPGLGEWSWGGFLLTWIWGIGNNVWWAFLVFIPWLGGLVMPWVLAFKGNEWAWRSKRWESVEHFKNVQHTWSVWGWGISIAITVLLTLMLIAGIILLVWGLQKSGVRWY